MLSLVTMLLGNCAQKLEIAGTAYDPTLQVTYRRATPTESYFQDSAGATFHTWSHPHVPYETFYNNGLYWSVESIDEEDPYKQLTVRYCDVATCNRCGPVVVISSDYEYLTNVSAFAGMRVNLFNYGDSELIEDNVMIGSASAEPLDNFRSYVRSNVLAGDAAFGEYLPVRLFSELDDSCSGLTGEELRGSSCGAGEPVVFSVRLLETTSPPAASPATSPAASPAASPAISPATSPAASPPAAAQPPDAPPPATTNLALVVAVPVAGLLAVGCGLVGINAFRPTPSSGGTGTTARV